MIKLASDIVQMCREYGEKNVRERADGKHQQSTALAIRGAEKDPILQAEGKMAECIFAVEQGLPMSAINWTGGAEFNGIDLVTNGGVSVDVKYTWPGRRLLIWSAGKGLARLKKKEFDVFVLVKCRLSDGAGESTHWIVRRDFIARHKLAPPPTNLTPGTLYMDQDELRGMAEFPASRAGLVDRKPDAVAGSTWDAYTWLRRYHPERLEAWLDRHPEVKSGVSR